MPRFQPGQSGNPNGRPWVGTSLAETIRGLGGEDGSIYAMMLHEIALSNDPKVSIKYRIEATKILLERGYGRLPQELETEAPADIIRASLLRQTLKEAGLLNGPGERQSSSSPQLQRWIAGDPDWDTAPSGIVRLRSRVSE